MCLTSIRALGALASSHFWKMSTGSHRWLIPSRRTTWMSVEKVASCTNLPSIQPCCKSQMHPAFLSVRIDLLIIEILVVHGLPCRELCAWWASNDPCRFLNFNECLSLNPVSLLGEVPWLTIGLVGPQVQSVQSSDVQRSPWPICLCHDVSSSVNLNKLCTVPDSAYCVRV